MKRLLAALALTAAVAVPVTGVIDTPVTETAVAEAHPNGYNWCGHTGFHFDHWKSGKWWDYKGHYLTGSNAYHKFTVKDYPGAPGGYYGFYCYGPY